MKATLFKEISDASAIIEIVEGYPLYDSFKEIDLSDKIAIVNGEEKPFDYITKEGDVVIIRTVPGAFTTVVAVISIVVAAVSLGVAIYSGIKAYEARRQAEELSEKLKNLNDDISNVPYLKGASNAIATGKSQPYIIGQHLFTPYKLISGYNVLSGATGSDQYYHVVLQGGFNKQVIRSVFCDDVKIKTWDAGLTSPQEGVSTLDTDSIFYDADSLIEIAQDGGMFSHYEFNRKIVTESPGDELKKSDAEDYENLIYTLEENTRSADICIMFNGLRAYDDSGNKISRTVSVVPAYSLNSGVSWIPFFFTQNGVQDNDFTYNVSTQIRFNAHIDFTYAQVKDLTAPVMIKIICTTLAATGSVNDQCYVQWIQSYIYNAIDSATANAFVDERPLEANEAALSTMIGLKIKASLSNEDKLDKINVRTAGIARTWNGTVWSTTKVPTSNPAAWLLEVLTSPTHLASQCDDSEIDLDSFGELYEYCETNALHCNTVLSEGDIKENVLAMILDTCQSVLYKGIYGKISVATDKVKENAIAILNTQNCISFSNKKDMSRTTDGIKINYTNAGADYVSDTYLVMRDGVTRSSNSILREMTVTGIEEYNHIVKYGRRLLAIEQLRPKTATAKVGKEGIYYTPLGKLLVQHPSLKIGLGSAEIKSVIVEGSNIIGLQLYEPIQYDSAVLDGFGVVIQAVGDDYCTPVSAAYTALENGYVTEILFVTPIALSASAIPHAGDVLSYGYLDSGAFSTITSPMIITGIEPTDEGFTLTLVDYNEAIYTTGTIPDYSPNITTRKTPISVPAEIPSATKDELADAIVVVNEGTPATIPSDVSSVSAVASQDVIRCTAAWSGSGIGNALTGFIFSISKNGGTSWTDYNATSNVFDYQFNRDTDGYPTAVALGTWRVRAKAVNAYGYVSANYSPSEAGQMVDTSAYVGWDPNTPTVSTRVSGRGISIGWNNAATWYGMGDAHLQIAKGYTVESAVPVLITDLETLEVYAPAIGLNPRLNYDNYREGSIDGFLVRAGSVFSIAVPLYGQNETAPVVFDTPYYVRVRSTTKVPTTANPDALIEGSWSEWQLVYGQGTTAQEVVANAIQNGHVANSAITANKINVEMLSAINANLGVITDGAMVGSETNYWALSRVYDTDGITVLYYEGAMRVGGEDQYLKVTPVVVGGVVTSYTIDFKVGTFTVTATGSTINGDFIVKSLDGSNTWATIDKTTGAFTILAPSITSNTNQVATTKFVKDVARPLSDLSRVMRINGDGVPIFPDNVAGRTYWQDDWATTDGWVPSGCTIAVADGKLNITTTTTDAYIAKIGLSFSGAINRLIRISVESKQLIPIQGDLYYSTSGHGFSDSYHRFFTIPKGKNYIDLDMGTLTDGGTDWITNTITEIRFDWGANTGDYYEIDKIYIGSGLYDTPVYGKDGQTVAVNHGVVPVNGKRGKALLFQGKGAMPLVFNGPVIGLTGTIRFKFKTSDTLIGGFYFGNTASSAGLALYQNDGGATDLKGFSIGGIAVNTEYTFSFYFSLTSLYVYRNGALLFEYILATPLTISPSNLYIGRNSESASGQDFTLYDFEYVAEAETLDAHIRYHNGDDAVDSQQKSATGTPHAIAVYDANGGLHASNMFAYDLVIDSNAKFATWAASGTWEKVLIKKGTWTLASGSVNLTTRGTKVVIGEPGSKLVFSSSDNGLYYATSPTSKDYYMNGVNIEIHSLGACLGFAGCLNVSECTCDAYPEGTAGLSSGFHVCDHLYNCVSSVSGSATGYGFNNCNDLIDCDGLGSGTAYGIGFHNCRRLSDCYGKGEGVGSGEGDGFKYCDTITTSRGEGYASTGNGYGFNECTGITLSNGTGYEAGFFNCKKCQQNTSASTPKYATSYADAGTSYACADTPNGGFNS